MNIAIIEETKKDLEKQLQQLNASRGNLIKNGKAHEAEIDKINQNIMQHNAAINETVGGINALTAALEKANKSEEKPEEKLEAKKEDSEPKGE